ncbi:MAG TPA: hypothetical protein VI756_24845 [Blastocatellia bacterium]
MKKITLSLIAMVLLAATSVSTLGRTNPRPSATDLQSSLPDGIGVASVDISQLTGSTLWGALASGDKPVRAIQSLQARMSDIGLKLTDLSQMAVCLSSPGTNGLLAAVTGSISEDALVGKLRADSRVKLTTESYKNARVYAAAITNKAGTRTQNLSFAFTAPAIVVLGSSKGVHAAIDAARGDKPSLAGDSKLQSALAGTGAGPIRFAIAPTPDLAKQLESSSIPLPDFSTVDLVFGSLGVSSGIDLNVTLHNDTADHATAMAAQLNSLLSMAKGMLGSSTNPKNQVILEAVKTVSITSSQSDVKITGSLSQDMLSKVFH